MTTALVGETLARKTHQRWEAIDWASPIPSGEIVFPEAHTVDVSRAGLTTEQRVAFNRLVACFTCELFIHFEAYVIDYLSRSTSVPPLSPRLVERFVEEERVHSTMFERLLHKLRPDLYPQASSARRFVRWSRGDDLALRAAPLGTFFLLAWLFEEITLFVPHIMAACPEESAGLLRDVMSLHAEEEEPHVVIDARVMKHLRETVSRPSMWLQAVLALPLLFYVDRKVKRSWRRVVRLASRELGLSKRQRARLSARGPSQSDILGMESFSDKMAHSGIAGTGVLRWALSRELRRRAP